MSTAANIHSVLGEALRLNFATSPTISTAGTIIDLGSPQRSSSIVSIGASCKLPNVAGAGFEVIAIATASATITTIAGVTVATLASGDVARFTSKSATTWTVELTTALYRTLTSNLVTVPIPVTSWREVSSGAVGNTAAGGGVLSSNTTPTVTPVNGATDPTQIITWAATNVDPILAYVPLPYDADLSTAGTLSFNCTIKSGGTTNAVGFTFNCFGPTGSDCGGGVTGTNQTTAYADKSSTTDLTTGALVGAKFATVMITPISHGTDSLVMKNAWLSCNRTLLTS